jgi:hypothetical protein
MVVFLGNTGTSLEEPRSTEPVEVVTKPKQVALPPEARQVAGTFILTAVQRKDLDVAWKLVGPGIRQGMTYEEWLTGNIPVIPYLGGIQLAPMKVDLATKDHALLEVVLVPKKGSKSKSEIFTLEMRLIGSGENRRWVVEGWTPRARPTIPTNPSN